jgi:peptide/nickel transport system permease protein
MTERRVGIALLAACAVAFVVIPVISPASSTAIGVAMSPPTASHPFGTDELGRDVFARVFEAGRLDLAITVISVGFSLALGMLAGLVVSTVPRLARELALRVIEAMIAIPYLVLAVGVCALLSRNQIVPGLPAGSVGVVIALVLAGWAPFAMLTISQVLAMRERESVVAARVLGYSYPRILLRHIAPAALRASVSFSATQAVWNIAILAGLALLGVGIQEPTPELGLMMQNGISLLPSAPWISLIPGAVILVLGIGFGLIADSFDGRENKG